MTTAPRFICANCRRIHQSFQDLMELCTSVHLAEQQTEDWEPHQREQHWEARASQLAHLDSVENSNDHA